MKKKKFNWNVIQNQTANIVKNMLFVVAIVTMIWLIICAFLKCFGFIGVSPKCILLDTKTLITFFGGCLSLWLVCFQLKKQSDVETVKLLGYLRELLNTGEKKKIHFYLLDSQNKQNKTGNDKVALLNAIESDQRYIYHTRAEVLEEVDKIRHSNVEVFDYLGVLELGAIMLERGVISEQEFDNQFKYRIENVYNSDLRSHVELKKEYYHYLIQHFDRLNLARK